MRWYDLIMCGNALKKPYVSSFEDLKGFEDFQFRVGKRVENWNPEAWIRCMKREWNGDPDDVLQNHLAVPIYSARLQVIIREQNIQGIQFLPLRVLRLDATEIPGFAIANILNTPPAMDMNRSEYDIFEDDYFDSADRGRVAGVFKMVLKRTVLEDCDIIRPLEFLVSEYASERFKRAFQAGHCNRLFVRGSAFNVTGCQG